MFIKKVLGLRDKHSLYGERLRMVNRFNLKHEELILSMMGFNNKLLLTGGTLLCSAGILPRQISNDIDFSVSEKLSEAELKEIINFFKLEESSTGNYDVVVDYSNDRVMTKELSLAERDIVQFLASDIKQDLMREPYSYGSSSIKIDIFNKEIIRDKDIYELLYQYPNIEQPLPLRCTHPSIPLSYKMRYALDSRVKEYKKHEYDLSHINDDYMALIKPLKNIIQLNRNYNSR